MILALQRGKADRRILQRRDQRQFGRRAACRIALRRRRHWPRLPAAPRCSRRRSIPRSRPRRSPPARAYPRQETAATRVWATPVPCLSNTPNSFSASTMRRDHPHLRTRIAPVFGNGVRAGSSRDLPGGAFFGVLDDNAHRRELIADPVGFLEILSRAGGGAAEISPSICLASTPLACCLRSSIPPHFRTGNRAAAARPQTGRDRVRFRKPRCFAGRAKRRSSAACSGRPRAPR